MFQSMQHFLYQNGFATAHEYDAGGFAPVHYAAMLGDPEVMQGLLEHKADINCCTRKDQPQSGIGYLTGGSREGRKDPNRVWGLGFRLLSYIRVI